MKKAVFVSVAVSMLVVLVSRTGLAEVTADRTAEGVVIKIDGKPFATYLTCSGSKPIVWPILGPTGKPMTRCYPMGEAPHEERKDHIHQRSFWFTHGKVNNIDFWAETGKNPLGTEVHREYVKVSGGKVAVVATRNDWLGPDGKKQLEDQRTLTFGATPEGSRWIDFDIDLMASVGPVTFNDTKEGSFGLRVSETMKVDAKLGGRIINSEGQVDKDAWARRAAWVDYQGPVEGETLGIAVLNHPSSFRYPTYWHVRTYGLYAANPFGVHDFTLGTAKTPEEKEAAKKVDGSFTLEKGKSIRLCYRVLFHRGDEKQGKVAETFAQYSKEKK